METCSCFLQLLSTVAALRNRPLWCCMVTWLLSFIWHGNVEVAGASGVDTRHDIAVA